MEPNLPNDCYACNRTCINSGNRLPSRPRRYFQRLYRPSVLSFSSSRRQLRHAESAAFCSAVSSRRYHPINRACITRAWPIMKCARMRIVCFVCIIGWRCYILDCNSYEFSLRFYLINVVKSRSYRLFSNIELSPIVRARIICIVMNNECMQLCERFFHEITPIVREKYNYF